MNQKKKKTIVVHIHTGRGEACQERKTGKKEYLPPQRRMAPSDH